MKQMSTIKFPNQTEVYEIVDAAARLDIAEKSDIGHTHTRSEITDFAHEHDERYYTETEIDTKISELDTSLKGYTDGKIASIPTVDSYTKAEVDSALDGKADKSHNHDDKYDAKGAADTALDSAKTYADTVSASAANTVKNELLNGAGDAYDTLKELGVLIDENQDAIEALETVASGKADKEHKHAIADINELQDKLAALEASIAQKTQVQFITWGAND